jgi:ABC-2 type transport system ATP-binding protein
MIIEVKHLEQEFAGFGSPFRLGPIDLTLNQGEIVAILGKNGAGKSTLFDLLTGTRDPKKGEVRVAGQKLAVDTPDVKRLIGYLPQNHVLPLWATPVEMLRYAATLLAVESTSISERLRYWDLTDFQTKPLATLSYGTQKRVALAVATLATPPAIILDEPFSGLDIYHIRALELELTRRKSLGLLSVLSSHIMSQTAALADRAFIIKDGSCQELVPWANQTPIVREQHLLKEFFP